MMDSRRLSTADVLALGITEKPTPKTDIPEDREKHECDIEKLDESDLQAALAGGKLLSLLEYYGCVYAWSDESGHHGRLLQYRSVTERHDFKSAQELVEWFVTTGYQVAG